MQKLIGILCLTFFSFNLNPDYLEWSAKTPLKFSDFKGVAPKKSSSKVNLATLISYETRQVQGQPPQVTVYNRVDRSTSWITLKKQEVLDIQQIHFNTSELYARKIRKEIKELNAKKVVDKEKYKVVVLKHTSTLHKIQRSKKVLLEDQPHLIRLWDKQIKDSLQIFKDFAK